MSLTEYIKAMPKVELHVHLEGATQPETLLKLAQRHQIALPADTAEGLREWFIFRDFRHFIEIYLKISECIRTPDDIELLTREFLQGQAGQRILHSEVTYTPYTHYVQKGLPFEDQLAAINRARAWAEAELGVTMGLIIDIARSITPEDGLVTAEWAIQHYENGVIALGLGGMENGHPPEKHAEAFRRAHEAGVTCILHAGEFAGAESIWGALNVGNSVRIGHGVRCLEDLALVAELRERQIPLEVCPSSNVRLGVVPSFAEHPLPRLIEEGLYVTLNSDDPPMFNTTLTDEYLLAVAHFGFDADTLEKLSLNALWAARLPEYVKASLSTRFRAEFQNLRRDLMGWPFREATNE